MIWAVRCGVWVEAEETVERRVLYASNNDVDGMSLIINSYGIWMVVVVVVVVVLRVC